MKRLELIYKIKAELEKTEIQNETGYTVGKRVGESKLLDKILTEIEDLLPECIFIENYDEKTLAQIVK